MTVLIKFVKWLVAILATSIGLIEAILKFVKEALTLAVDILFPVIPFEGFKNTVTWIRSIVNMAYEWLNVNKARILRWLGAISA